MKHNIENAAGKVYGLLLFILLLTGLLMFISLSSKGNSFFMVVPLAGLSNCTPQRLGPLAGNALEFNISKQGANKNFYRTVKRFNL